MKNLLVNKIKKYLETHSNFENLNIDYPELNNEINENNGIIYYMDLIYGKDGSYLEKISYSSELVNQYWNYNRISVILRYFKTIERQVERRNAEINRFYTLLGSEGFAILINTISGYGSNKEIKETGSNTFEQNIKLIQYKYGYFPHAITIKDNYPSIYNIINKYGGYKIVVADYNLVTEDEVISLYAYFLDKNNKIRCTNCSSPLVIKYGDSRSKKHYNQGYKCKVCGKRFNSTDLAKNNILNFIDRIRYDNNLENNIKVIFFKEVNNFYFNSAYYENPVFFYKYIDPFESKNI